MTDHSYLDVRRMLCTAIGTALLTLAIVYTFALYIAPVQAQSGTIELAIDKRLQGSDVVQVGQELLFTIRIANNSNNITVTDLPLIDEYDSNIISFVRADPVPSTTSEGILTWNDLTSTFGELPPGEIITVTTVFRAIRAEVATINRARIEAAQGSGGESGGGEDGASSGEAEGGRVIVTKALAQDSPAVSGQPITFTISIRNDGAADIVSLPLEDTPNTEFLQFIEADPPPSSVESGGTVLRWDDVLPDLGLSRLRPDEVITVTTVFTALKSFEGTGINNSNAVEVQDEFGNQVEAPRQDEVPIRIVPGPDEVTPTATPEPAQPRDDDDDDDGGSAESTVTSIPNVPTIVVTPTTDLVTPTEELTGTTDLPVVEELTPTAVMTPVDADIPAALPETGRDSAISGWLLIGVALASVGMLVVLYRRSQMPR